MKKFTKLAVGLALGAVSVGSAFAAPLTITGPSPIGTLATGTPNPTCTGVGTGNDATFISTSCTAMSGLTRQYTSAAANDGNEVEGDDPLKGSYTTNFVAEVGTANDWVGGTIRFDGGTAVNCASSCWLIVKDGNMVPGRYAYNLSSLWDGVSTITLERFWLGSGSISNITLWSGGTKDCTTDCGPDRGVPEPATLALVGVALAGVGLSRRRRQA